jgi:act minimal PKS acyl carrier protein
MSDFTLTDLQRILESSSGAADGADWASPEILHLTFDQVGYDSLALLEMAAVIDQEYGARIPDDAIPDLKTPQLVLDYVNDLMATA